MSVTDPTRSAAVLATTRDCGHASSVCCRPPSRLLQFTRLTTSHSTSYRRLTASVSQLPASSNRVSTRCIDIPLDNFTPVTPDEVVAIIRKSLSKQCPLDPMQSWLLKNISYTMAPVIAAMCNASITLHKFPVGQKCALVRPLLKKATLDPLDLNCCRPTSNLTFVSKILERVIDSRIADHANNFVLFSPV